MMRARSNPSRQATSLLLATLLVVLLVAAAGQPATGDPSSPTVVKIPLVKGDSLQVRFEDAFDCSDLAEGFVPRVTVAEDKVISGVVLVTEGTPVSVKVPQDQVADNGHAGKPGKLAVEFTSLVAVDEREVPLAGSMVKDGSGRSVVLLVLTLFLLKGEEPSVEVGDMAWARIAEDTYIYAERR